MALTQVMTFAGFMPADVVNQQGPFMHKPLIIQLLGQARSGKDWTAKQLKLAFEAQGKSVAVMSYAAPMKRIASTLFGITLEQLDSYKNNPKNYFIHIDAIQTMTNLHTTDFRVFLQRMGNEAIKSEFGDTVWADLMLLQIHKSTADIAIIPDCRFQVELGTFPQAFTIRVINRDLPPPMNHASETELIDCVTDFTLDNTAHKLTAYEVANLAKIISTPK